jgi:1-acyl-sn-glycerol-3-phosphate acyltransferase
LPEPGGTRLFTRSDRFPAVIMVRSILFNVLFYLNMLALLLVAQLTMLMPRRAVIEVAKLWGRTSIWLLRAVCRTDVEFRGLEKIPQGPLIVAAKHQSMLESFALVPLFADPTFIVKRELMWIPIFGWCMWWGGMVSVDRGAGSQALTAMTARARERIRSGRQLIIFPEGTRRAAGAEPSYKFGVAHLYAEVDVPCVPVALNSGLFWPRRSFRRLPGTIVVEFLDPIPPGLDKQAFLERLRDDIESATARLIAEGESELRRNGVLAPHQRTA